ncbi:type I restriction-modification system subunit M/S [Endozoicomonas sp. 4G]|uniref:N-6 DNA methylase n=1 Tax=Endozoicomonas sp. 4G TaxID=2872754 RepID=UPI0020789CC4|nr:type I restriction-modification system subunit M/S [Endozoicomonas sp. 4G]
MSRDIVHALIPGTLQSKNWYQAYLVLLGQLFAWARLSELEFLPEQELPDNHAELEPLFRTIGQKKVAGAFANVDQSLWQTAWQQGDELLGQIPSDEITRACHSVMTAKRHNLLKYNEIPLALQRRSKPLSSALPEAMGELLEALSGSGGSCYLPNANSFMLGADLALAGQVYSEQPAISTLDALSVLINPDIHIAQGHPVLEPAFFTSGQLQKFDHGVGLLTADHRYKVNEVRDIFQRLDTQVRSEEMLFIRHMFWRCSGQVVIAVPGRFLQKNTEQHIAFRRWLLKQNRLHAIIKLPKGLLPGRATPLYVLVAKRQVTDNVYLIDASSDYFKATPVRKKGTAKIQLNNVDVILEQMNEDSASPRFSKKLDKKALIQGSVILDPGHYCADIRRIDLLGKPVAASYLETLVDIIRAQALRDIHLEKQVFLEVTANDINEAGEIEQPAKEIHVDEKGLKRAKQQLLQPGDVLLVIKGQAGRIAIVPDVCGLNWVANQSFVILRLKQNTYLNSSIVLFRFLRSQTGKALVDSICTESQVPFIHGNDLKQLPIPEWSAFEQQQAEQSHREILKLYAQVRFIRDKARMIEDELLKEA